MSARIGDRRLLWLIFVVSLALRFGAVGVALLMDVHPVNDEWGYSQRAHGWAAIYGDLFSGDAPTSEHWQQAYQNGFQPPLHPMALGAAFATGLSSGVSGRLLSALLTALATPLVFLLTRRMAGRGAALAAAVLHIIYPTFTFFAHSLWAEPLFILLLLGAVERAMAAREADGRRRLFLAVAAGACAGLLCLTRTAGLAFMIVLPVAYLGERGHWHGRKRAAVLMLAVAVTVIAPWQMALHREEGRHAVLATSSGLNLAMGNNPFVNEACGSTWTDLAANIELLDDMARFAAENGIQPGYEGFDYALAQIHADPAEAVRRVGDRLRLVWSADLFPVRQMLQAVCRPVPNGLAGLHWLCYFVAYLALMVLIVRGLLARSGVRHQGLILIMVTAGLLGPAATVGFSRLHLPLFALLLPLAGVAWARRHDPVPISRRVLMSLTMGLVAWMATTSLEPVIEHQLAPSAWYRPLVSRVAHAVGAEATFADQVIVTIDPDGPEALRIAANPQRVVTITQDVESVATVHMFGSDSRTRARLVLQPLPGDTDVLIDPISSDHGWRWRDLGGEGLPGVRLRWQGGVSPVASSRGSALPWSDNRLINTPSSRSPCAR